MRRKSFLKFASKDDGAIAPLFAISLFALVAVGGVAFDYARLMTMTSELKNGADQAALAAATQLDGAAGAITRAKSAANDYFAKAGGPYANNTMLAQGGGVVGGLTFRFYDSYTNDTPGSLVDETAAGADAKARVVEVTVGGRQVYFALTAVVARLASDSIGASAMAAVESSTCKVPPLMICAPSADFPTAADIGKGILIQPGAKVGYWQPGDFGYIDLLGGGANGLISLLGSNGLQDECIPNDGTIDAKPGDTANVPQALNTRFDIYPSGNNIPGCQSNGDFCPVKNTRKDLARTETWTYTYPKTATAPVAPNCDSSRKDGTSASGTLSGGNGNGNGNGNNGATTYSVSIGNMTQNNAYHFEGYPRDNCHYSGTCGKFGDGTWDRSTYISTVHSGNSASYSDLNRRYDIYKAERDNNDLGARLVSRSGGTPSCPTNGNQPCTVSYTNVCAYPTPLNYSAFPADKDRRILTVAAVDCSGQTDANKHSYKVLRWVDLFLVEPSFDRATPYGTGKDQIYSEVIGVAERPGGGIGFQYFGRNKVVLIR